MIKGEVKYVPPVQVQNTANLTDYRKIVALNQSSLKDYDNDPMKFYKQYVMKESRKEKDSFAILLGSIVDYGVLECRGNENEFEQGFDKYFVLFDGNKGTGQAFLLADYLFQETLNSTNESNVVTTSFETRFADAFARVQADGKYSKKTVEWAIQDFVTSPAKDYFDTLLDSIGKKVVDLKVVDRAKQLIKQLLSDPFTENIFRGNDDKEMYTKFVIEWKYTTLFGDVLDCKQEVDHLLIDHQKKEVIISDLKCNYDNELFEYSYLKYGYYIQNAFYHLGVKYWLKENDMADYTIVDGMRFIVADTSGNNRRPLIYWTTKNDLEKGLNGFVLKGQRYNGVYGLLESVNWAMSENIFNITKENYDNNGQCKINIQYE